MFYQLRLIKGTLYPNHHSYQLQQAEAVPGFWIRLFVLIFFSGALSVLGGFFGLHQELLANGLTTLPTDEYEARKLLFMLGQGVWGLFFAVFTLLFPALFFWTVTDGPFKKYIVIQMHVLVLLLAHKALYLITALLLGLDKFSSPFSLGVAAQYVTSNELLIMCFGSISVFHLWGVYIQYAFLKRFSNTKLLIPYVIAINVFILIVSSLIYYSRLEKLI